VLLFEQYQLGTFFRNYGQGTMDADACAPLLVGAQDHESTDCPRRLGNTSDYGKRSGSRVSNTIGLAVGKAVMVPTRRDLLSMRTVTARRAFHRADASQGFIYAVPPTTPETTGTIAMAGAILP
jgi:hypothetical protein